MNYQKEQLESINKVILVFSDYIKTSNYLDILWSNKFGYIYVSGLDNRNESFATEPILITDAKRLCDLLIFYIACDTITANGPFHEICESTPEEQALIRNTLQPFMKHLPEYSALVDELFIELE